MNRLLRRFTSKRAISRTAVAIIIVLIVIAIAAAIYISVLKPSQVKAQPITLAPSSLLAIQGTPITFTVSGLLSNGIANLSLGDGHYAQTNSTVIYTYRYPGRYLVSASEVVNGKVVIDTDNATRLIQVTPNVNSSFAQLISIPVITFNLTRNPGAPLVNVNQTVFFYGGFLEEPTGTNISIISYVWNFGNGKTVTVQANSSTSEPQTNPVNTTYLEPGPYPFDPQIDYESVGAEVVSNIFGTLLVYNGSSTTSFLPMIASQIPSVQNGEVNANYTSYTFQIRQGLKFSNGDPITAYDVWYSMIRDMLFVGGAPGTPDWILAQYLIPGATIGVPIMTAANDTSDFNAIMNAVTYSNSSQTVTFHLVRPITPQLFFTTIADPLGAGVLDAAWLQ